MEVADDWRIERGYVSRASLEGGDMAGNPLRSESRSLLPGFG